MANSKGGAFGPNVVDGRGVTTTGHGLDSRTDAVLFGLVARDLADPSYGGRIISPADHVVWGPSLLRSPDIAFNFHGNSEFVLLNGLMLVGDSAGTTKTGIYATPSATSFGRLMIQNTMFVDFDAFAMNFTAAGAVTLSDIYIRNNQFINCAGLLSTTNVTFDTSCRIELPGVGSVASGAAVTLPFYEVVTITGTTNITSLTASWPGRRVTLVFAGVLTFTDGSNLKLNGNYVTTADDTITLVSDGTNWIETGRSAN